MRWEKRERERISYRRAFRQLNEVAEAPRVGLPRPYEADHLRRVGAVVPAVTRRYDLEREGVAHLRAATV